MQNGVLGETESRIMQLESTCWKLTETIQKLDAGQKKSNELLAKFDHILKSKDPVTTQLGQIKHLMAEATGQEPSNYERKDDVQSATSDGNPQTKR